MELLKNWGLNLLTCNNTKNTWDSEIRRLMNLVELIGELSLCLVDLTIVSMIRTKVLDSKPSDNMYRDKLQQVNHIRLYVCVELSRQWSRPITRYSRSDNGEYYCASLNPLFSHGQFSWSRNVYPNIVKSSLYISCIRSLLVWLTAFKYGSRS